ncbi:hypothetical protein Tco_0694292 [Tanacetum coccineum]
MKTSSKNTTSAAGSITEAAKSTIKAPVIITKKAQMDNGFVAGQAALKAESSKVAKHEKACLENQHVFIPFAFDTFGFLAPEADEFLNRVQRVVQSDFSTPKTQNFIFSRIGFAIQKKVAAQLVARLPAILL